MKYQVGDLQAFQPDDPEMVDKRHAFNFAASLSIIHDDTVFGIWTGQDDESELIALAFRGDLFRLNITDFPIEINLKLGELAERAEESVQPDAPPASRTEAGIET